MFKTKIYIFILFYVLNTVSISIAQQSFEVVINTDMRTSLLGCTIDGDNINLFTGYQFNPSQQIIYSDAVILKVSNDGDTLLRIYHMIDSSCSVRKSVALLNNSYLVFGSFGAPESNYKKRKFIWIQDIDENLNTIWEKSYKLPGEYWNPVFEVAMTSDSIIYLAGYASLYGSPSYQYLFAMKFNANGDTLKTYYTDIGSPPCYTFGILPRNDSNGVITFGSGFDYNMTFMQALEIDSNLNLTVHGLNPPVFSGSDNVTSKWFTGSTSLLSCRSVGPGGTWDIELMMMNDDFQITDQKWIGRPDTNDYPAWRTSMDFIDKNNIWVSGQLKHLPGEPVDSKILLYLLDSTLTVKGMKYYGGDMNYSAMTTTATSDGGCILGCTIYDWENGVANDQDLWIKKVFPNDILTNAEDTPDPNDRDVLIYPNPFNDKIIIKTIRKDLKISLYTINGIKVIESEIENNLDYRINTSNLEKGTYIYEIKYGNRIIQTGKVIKQ